LLAIINDLQQLLVDTLRQSTPALLAGSIAFTALALIPGQACNSTKPWWRNPELGTDFCYVALSSAAGRYLATFMVEAVVFVLFGLLPTTSLLYLLTEGGPLHRLPFLEQLLLYVVLSDFLLYWIHRVFHGGIFWPFHAIHHAVEKVDWTTAYRFHPINIMFSVYLVAPLMIYLGISAEILALLAPFNIAYSYFVHANLNWTLGPLKYIFASPVFHRWHHIRQPRGGYCNFAPTLAVWDVLFGTFYMPVGQLPNHYGIDNQPVPRRFLQQLVYPFKELVRMILASTAKIDLFIGRRFRS
jgi:sterol desaturase/sphingolipid hydroxylase (fatty acid hydroxylase superfamily)